MPNPDRERSRSGLQVEEDGEGWRWVLGVKGLGSMIIKTKSGLLDKFPRVISMSISHLKEKE